MFHVGQLVICVNDQPQEGAELAPRAVMPVRGRIYTVRSVHQLPYPMIRLCELNNAHLADECNGIEPAFDAEHFRPVDDSRLEIFRKALRDAPVDGELVE